MSASDASAFYMFHGCNKFCRCASLCRACAAPLFWLPSPLFFHCLVVGRTPRQWLRTSLSSTRQPDSCDALPSRHRQSCTRTHTKQNGGHEMMLVSCVHIFSSPLLPPAHVNFERTRNVCFHESSLVDCSDAFYLFSLVFCCLFLYGCVPVGVCVCVPPRLRQRSARRAVPEIPFFFPARPTRRRWFRLFSFCLIDPL
jgi:hypothetical protein